MLLELKVSNFGIIEELHWRLEPGLNVLTGETGAGKSLVIDAVETLLSGKADESAVRHEASQAFLEAVFDISAQPAASRLRELLDENGLLPPEESTLVISGEIRRQGRSAFRVNGKSVTRSLLTRLGRLLVDIHGQSQHLSLLDRDFHLDFLDAYAGTAGLRRDFGRRAARLSHLEQELKALNEQEMEMSRQEEFLRFQVEELRRADLKEDEDEALEQELKVQASSERLKGAAHQAYLAIYGNDGSEGDASILEKLEEARRALQGIVAVDDTLRTQLDSLAELGNVLSDIAGDLRSYRDRVEYDPQRLREIESRLELIRDLKRKYGHTIAEILEYQEKAEGQLAGISTSGERRRGLEEEIASLKKEMGEAAAGLSARRAEAAARLTEDVDQELKELNMPKVKFEALVTRRETEAGLTLPDGVICAFTRDGVDNIEFRASTNPGEPMKPLAAIASTGEMSRFMLAMKSALAEADSVPVLIFDEIDIGVGGRSGETVGRKLGGIAAERQTVCITHLPQIAVFADAHYTVRKEATGGRTTSRIERLEGEDVVREIAVMLSGPQLTETAVNNARELMDKARVWKKGRASAKLGKTK